MEFDLKIGLTLFNHPEIFHKVNMAWKQLKVFVFNFTLPFALEQKILYKNVIDRKVYQKLSSFFRDRNVLFLSIIVHSIIVIIY